LSGIICGIVYFPEAFAQENRNFRFLEGHYFKYFHQRGGKGLQSAIPGEGGSRTHIKVTGGSSYLLGFIIRGLVTQGVETKNNHQ